MAILIVIRNSRADEDSGQAELVASGVLARQSRLAVAALLATIASVALGVVCFLLTLACGGGAAATLTLSATFTASGLMFGGLAAVTAQLGSDARTASGLAVAALGVCFAVRGYIDSSGGADALTWLTPLGWLEQTRPGGGTDDANRGWPLLIALGFAVVLLLAAFALQARRDFGQGLIAPRPGPARAGLVGNVWGLAFRLNRGSMLSWLIALAGLGLLLGNLATAMSQVLADNPALADVLASGAAGAGNLTFAFVITILDLVAIIAAVAGVQVVMRIHAEESDFRVEPLLAGSLRRPAYLASNVVVALLVSAVGLVLAGTGIGLVASAREPSISTVDVIGQAAATVPATWTLIALAVAAVGAEPSRRLIGWLGIVATFGLTILGPTFKLPTWALDISPLRHVPMVTAASPAWSGLAWLTSFLLLFLTVGFTGFRRRDIL